MFRFVSWTKTSDQDFKKNAKNETEVHYQFLETKNPTTKHSKFQFQFRP